VEAAFLFVASKPDLFRRLSEKKGDGLAALGESKKNRRDPFIGLRHTRRQSWVND
jgi:hypothetical protein